MFTLKQNIFLNKDKLLYMWYCIYGDLAVTYNRYLLYLNCY